MAERWKLERGLPPVVLRSAPDGSATLYGRFANAGEWAEIKSRAEGHFLESVSQRAFAVSIHENRDHIRCLFHHGLDPSIGTKPLGVIRNLEGDTSYEVDLFDADYVNSLIPGLKTNQYGASFRCKVLADEIEPSPPRTSWNPDGIPLVKIREATLVEFGPTPFPAYKGTTGTTAVRSSVPVRRESCGITDDLQPDERWVTRSKPGQPGVIERERVNVGEPASWEGHDRGEWWRIRTPDRGWQLA